MPRYWEATVINVIRFKSFQSRILFFVLSLLFLILVTSNILVGLANSSNAHELIRNDLKTASNIFLRLMDTRTSQLADSARLLSSDYAFKTAFATSDRATIVSAMVNQQSRIGADIMLLISPEGKVIASTDARYAADSPFNYPRFLKMAEDEGEAYSLLDFGNGTYQTVIVPLLAPIPVAWIAIGFKINNDVAMDFKKLSNLEVSFFREEPKGGAVCFASTFPEERRSQVAQVFRAERTVNESETVEVPVMGDVYVSLKINIGKTPEGNPAYTVLQRSLTRLMKPYDDLQRVLLAISAFGLLISTVAGVFVARSVSKPVMALVEGVKRVQEGDYTGHVAVEQEDEVGTLAHAINQMTVELSEKDRVRNLLGKVVSPAIAEELLGKKLELGGEEREITILFSDIRGFTGHAEGISPKDVLSFLNVYFTRMSAIIETNGGVVDKYIGDEIMALFGAPLIHENDVDRALDAALQMVEALDDINKELASQGMPHLDIGIGVNTDMTVVGNMGSISRLNYTAIGDGVNLASRIQKLTREPQFSARIIISENTLAKSKGKYLTQDLGKVNIRGKKLPIAVYSLLGRG